MPGKIKVKVLAGRNLPVMDRAGDTTDAFVEIKFGGVTHKTDVCRKSLNPHWNSTEWYRFEVDESELQDEPLQLRLMDHDTYSANDAIGKVVISLAPLLAREANKSTAKGAPQGGVVMSGWIPVFDTMHGIRGELNVIVKVELFSDFNKYKTSSVGVQFFHCPMIPPEYRVSSIHGFVEELVVNDDPEYQWIDKIRTPRASNEARQVAFIKLSNQVQRLVGLKAAELGANAVVGYQQDFDLEGEAGVVARAIGTAVSITPLPTPSQLSAVPPCSQQQLKRYLDILATGDDSSTDLNQYYQSHQDELQKVLMILNPKTPSLLDETDNIDDEDKIANSKNYTGDFSFYQDNVSSKSLKHMAEDQMELNKLLNCNESLDSEPIGPLKKIKKMKNNFFTKRLAGIRSRKMDKQDDQISIKSNSSESSRISLTDLKNELNIFKRLRKPKLRVTTSDEQEQGIGMASILARSVIHVHTSLACITETQDSEHSRSSTLRRTSESEPNMSISDDDMTKVDEGRKSFRDIDIKPNESLKKRTDSQYSSLSKINKNENNPIRIRKTSESCPGSPSGSRVDNSLKLPREVGYFDSVSSAVSGDSSTELYSSSDDENDSSDLITDTEKSSETTSSLVQSIMDHNVDPAIVAKVNNKLRCLACATPDLAEIIRNDRITIVKQNKNMEGGYETGNINIQKNISVTQNEDPSNSQKRETSVLVKPDHLKMSSPLSHKKVCQSMSVPTSPSDQKHFGFVYRSSARLRHQLSKFSKNRLIKSISHYSLLPKKKQSEIKVTLSHPNSASDIQMKALSRETVLGGSFLSYTDLLSLYKDEVETKKPLHQSDELFRPKVSMYIGSEPVSRCSMSAPSSPNHTINLSSHKLENKDKSLIKPSGLIHTAMETILMDRVQSLLLPTSPNFVEIEKKQFFADVHNRLEEVEESKKKENMENRENVITRAEHVKTKKKLIRQNSIQSATEIDKPTKTFNETDPNIVIPCYNNHQEPMLQHFHPIIGGAHRLETIPSLSDSHQSQSVDTESVDTNDMCDTNRASVCDNSHAAWVVNRNEREKEKPDKDKGSPRHARHESCGGREPSGTVIPQAASGSTPMGMHRRSSDSDLSITPKGGSLNTSVGNTGGGAILRPSMNRDNLEMLEYPFLTMSEYPPGFIVHIGGTVCARSVKLVEGGGGGGGDGGLRQAWWAELRTELRAHARALRCHAVLAYTETAAICEDVCILSASGTAAVINLDCDFNAEIDAQAIGSKNPLEENEYDPCSVAHVPYSPGAGPYRAELSTCGGCRRARVPAVLLATIAKPQRLPAYSKAVTLTAVAGRMRRAAPSSEPGARDISDQLPFLEYELYKLLLAKLRMQGANALFSLQTQIAVGERYVTALASGTAVKLAGLPGPTPPRIKATENDKEALEIQKALLDTFNANKTANGYDVSFPAFSTRGALPEVEGEEAPVLDLCSDKDACILELDEAEDVATAKSLATRYAHTDMPVYKMGMKTVRSAPPHAFTQVFRGRLSAGSSSSTSNYGGHCGVAERLVSRALAGIAYKLRRLQPCALVAPNFRLELPEQDEIQLVVSGAAIRLQDPSKPESSLTEQSHNQRSSNQSGTGDVDDEIFALDEEQSAKQVQIEPAEQLATPNPPSSVSLTSLSGVDGCRAARRVCALRLLFVRETTTVRELGGLSGFLHTFTCEALAIVRAYTVALGGNALTSFYITQLMIENNPQKNQGQCLLSVGGDVVHITY